MTDQIETLAKIAHKAAHYNTLPWEPVEDGLLGNDLIEATRAMKVFKYSNIAKDILAAIQADPLAYVTPKPLEWAEWEQYSKTGVSAPTGIGRYFAYKDYGGIRLILNVETIRYYPTLEAAQAAAQLDYETRIMECLE